jgi:hypothetical protein
MADGGRQNTPSASVLGYLSSTVRIQRQLPSESNANRARGRDALPGGTADLKGSDGLIDEAGT